MNTKLEVLVIPVSYKSVQSPRYQAAYVFLRLWRWSLLPLLRDSFAIVVVRPRSYHVLHK